MGRRSNANTQSNVQQFGNNNANAQGSVQQYGRRGVFGQSQNRK